jgi:hypothetical protein
MPQYAVIVSHPPDDCPLTNKAVRAFAKKTYEQLPELLKKYNTKLLMDIHLDPSHKAFMLFEAPTAEAVRDVMVFSGMTHFLDAEFHLVTPVSELLKHADEMPTLY